MVGDLAIARRTNQFEVVYDVPERVLPDAVLATPTPPVEEQHLELVRRAAVSHGVATLRCLADYYRMRTDEASVAVATLVESGELEPVAIEGWTRPAFLHRDARRPRRVGARALLSPFDPVVWERERAERLFDFYYRIEIYVPKEKRVHGYYVLPFLLRDEIVARVDLKADRATGTAAGTRRLRRARRTGRHRRAALGRAAPARGLAGPRRGHRRGARRPGAAAPSLTRSSTASAPSTAPGKLAHLRAEPRGGRPVRAVGEQFGQNRGDRLGRRALADPAADARRLQAARHPRLVGEPVHRHHHQREVVGERLHRGAVPAMADDQGGVRHQLDVRDEPVHLHAAGHSEVSGVESGAGGDDDVGVEADGGVDDRLEALSHPLEGEGAEAHQDHRPSGGLPLRDLDHRSDPAQVARRGRQRVQGGHGGDQPGGGAVEGLLRPKPAQPQVETHRPAEDAAAELRVVGVLQDGVAQAGLGRRVHRADRETVDHDEVGGTPRDRLEEVAALAAVAERGEQPPRCVVGAVVERPGVPRGLDLDAGAGEGLALRLVPEEADVVAAGLELVGDAERGRHVAAAVPRHEEDLGHGHS